VRDHPEARAEVRESVEFYETRLNGLGLRFLAAVEGTVERISASPEAGSPPGREFRKRNDAIALGWAAFFGRPGGVVGVLLNAQSDPSQRNKHGLTPLACAVGGTQGRWKQFSNASLDDWQRSADAIRARGGVE